jgi:DNA-directed RNA polymerase subunit RPC12/RpoP
MKAIKMAKDSDAISFKCFFCRGRYDLKKEVKKAELLGNRNILCPHCSKKIGVAQY